ncbi:hypothetical protein B0H14DRAFT_3483908 [Mycena olivaceomarginata]|nr:hypothetical protein B0H14DRAFT_3483908 [Mycena olivaceomarginata]
MGVDMEAAQGQGTSDSFLSMNEPEYSGISTNDPDEFAFGVTSLKSYVTPDVLKCLLDFPYMKTGEDVAHFTSWIGTLNIKKVRGFVLGTVFSPRHSSQTNLTPITATIPVLPFIDPSPAPAPVDVALPFDFGDDLARLENLGFMSETSQTLDASLNNIPLVNIVPNNNPGGTEFQFDANGALDWFFANVSQGGGDFAAPSSQLDWNARGPDSLDPSSSNRRRGGSISKGSVQSIDVLSTIPQVTVIVVS